MGGTRGRVNIYKSRREYRVINFVNHRSDSNSLHRQYLIIV